MKQLFLIVAISFCSIAAVSAQELKDPTMKAPFTERSGNFLVLTTFDKIGKSEITIDYVQRMRQELDDSKKQLAEQEKLNNEQKREIDDLKKDNSLQKRALDDQKKETTDLKRTVNDLVRKVEELQRKVK
ncbi:hypothetical protein LJB78_00265 [Bacteroidales bacterium OttesenSCG-928-J16]|nr:hypothetical protein [Bacteroidales bacterium OttesenSCG-928-J16]